MLNVFPELLTYGLAGPVLLRVVLGIITINLGYLKLTTEKKRWEISLETLHLKPADIWTKALGILQIVTGVLLIIGLYTQLAALLLAIIFTAEAYFEAQEETFFARSFIFYLLLLTISLSLLFLGAGFYAIDLPL